MALGTQATLPYTSVGVRIAFTATLSKDEARRPRAEGRFLRVLMGSAGGAAPDLAARLTHLLSQREEKLEMFFVSPLPVGPAHSFLMGR